MILHISLILFLLILGLTLNFNNEKNNKKIYLIISFVILFILSAFRSANIGNDTKDYFYMFKIYGQAMDVFNLDTQIELGYIILNKIIYSFTNNPTVLLTITSGFVLSSIAYFIYKNSVIAWLSVFLFINFRIYYFTLSGIRQSIALAVVLISYKYLAERKFVPFLLCILLASSFHVSALIFLIVYPLSLIKFNKNIVIGYAGVSLVLFLFFDSFMQLVFAIFPKYSVYQNGTFYEGAKLGSIVDFVIIILIFLFISLVKDNFFNLQTHRSDKSIISLDNLVIRNIYLHIISIAVVVTFVSINAAILNRSALYFFFFTIILIPLTISKINNRNARLLVTYAILILSFAYNLIVLVYRPEWQHVYPFEFFWQYKY